MTVARLKSVPACGALAAALLVGAGVVGCGSESDEGAAEAQEVVEDIQSLQEGEILIKGSSSPRAYGPYVFRRAGYNVRFEHGTDGDAPGRLVVALGPKGISEQEPNQLVIDSTRAVGTELVAAHGRLYVHVREASRPYVLRFTPRR